MAEHACDGVDADCGEEVEPDDDGDGVRSCSGDCDDGDALMFPDAEERCNGIDDDCDGVHADESATVTFASCDVWDDVEGIDDPARERLGRSRLRGRRVSPGVHFSATGRRHRHGSGRLGRRPGNLRGRGRRRLGHGRRRLAALVAPRRIRPGHLARRRLR